MFGNVTCVTAQMQFLKFMHDLEVTWCDIFLDEVILLDTSICSKKDFFCQTFNLGYVIGNKTAEGHFWQKKLRKLG